MGRFLDREALFVTGTDTGVGKTVASAAICRAWQALGREVCALKAVAAGGSRNKAGHFFCEDSDTLAEASTERGRQLLEKVLHQPARCPLQGASKPMAPWSASLLDNRPLDVPALKRRIEKVRRACAEQQLRLLVEGAGGPLVPLAHKKTVADLIAASGIPAVLVGRTELGTISHTLMALEVLSLRGVQVAGVILSRRRGGALTTIENASIAEITDFLPRGIALVILPFEKSGKPRLPIHP